MSANGSNWEKITKAAVTIVTFGAAIPLRKKVLANALLRAQPEVEDFKTKTNPIVFVPLDKKGKAAVQNFATINKEAEHIHNTAVTEAKKMKVPVPGKVQSLSESQKQIDAIGAGLNEIIKTTNEKKALNSAAQHVAFHMAKDHLKKNALASGIAALPSIAIAADIGGITGGEGALGDIVPGDMIDATDILLGAAAFPGFLSGTKSLFKEFDMLSNGETTFDEALKNGILPAAGDVLLTSVTLGIDVALFSGIPVTTFLTNIFGWKCKKIVPQEAIQSDWDLLKPYYKQIKDQERKATEHVNGCITENFKDFPSVTEKIPVFSADTKTQEFIKQLVTASYQDMGALAYEIETKTNRTIQELPKRNWKDKLLSIDRPREIAKLYKQAGTELTSALDGKASCFDKVANENISDIPGVLKQVVQNGRVVKVIASLPQELPEMAANYKQTLDAWIKSVQDMWTTGNQKVDVANQKENEELIKVKDNVLPYMRGPRDRIYSNLKRLGIDTKYTPALP